MVSNIRFKILLALMVLPLAVIGCSPTTSSPEPVNTGTSVPPTIALSTPTATPTPLPTEAPRPEPTATDTLTTTDIPSATSEPTPSEKQVVWTADGRIDSDEYAHQDDFSGLRFLYSNDDNYLYFAIEGDTSGWVAVGFDPENRMQGANFLFGFISGDAVNLWDAFGTAPTGPNHPPDEELGGTVDITSFAGVEENGITRFEIQIPLNSGDPYDKTLVPGQTYPYIIAMGGDDSFNSFHIKFASGQLAIE